MKSLKDFGLISRYEDYFTLPLSVLEDVMLVAGVTAEIARAEAAQGKRR